ncbi:cadherin-like domain-containing protein [Vibrio ichthyoenteri]|uniref:cadherin-like domain-containing protein n=1 Tax=Vibrio ichthyoenteri TaxID=142461 RepID=UPI001F495F11|nr:cadherin-like domain-containing protein [Vibrio ichthyoenteri]
MSLANLASGQVLVIDINGDIRVLNSGEQPLPGELVLDFPLVQNSAELEGVNAQQVTPDGLLNDVSQDIAGIISAIEQGEDPTLSDPDLAPAAGGPQGSSLGLSGTIGRDGSELLAETQFVTQGSSPLNLSHTQSQGLISLLNSPSDSLPIITPSVPTTPGTAPIAVDDPIGFSLVQGDMSISSDSNQGWNEVILTGSFNGDESKVNILDDDRVGVIDGAPWAGPTGQLQYDRESGQSEKLSIKFDQPATEGRFAVTNLYTNEGEGKVNHEKGTWVAYLNGVAVASGVIEAADNGEKTFVDIDTDGYAFDEVIFQANEYTNGLVDDIHNDSSDFFIAGIEVSSDDTYATNQGEELRIPIADILANDSDLEGDTLSITFVNADGSRGLVRIEGDEIVFQPNTNTYGSTTLEYQITDGNGGFDEANIQILVNPAPSDALVEGVFLRDSDGIEQDTNQVHEGESLIYTVVLDKPTFGETTFAAVFTGVANTSDVSLENLTFTNGVTLITGASDGEFQFVVPVGVKEFDVYVPTIVDNENEGPEELNLTVGSLDADGILVEQTGTGTILDNTAPTFDTDPFAYQLSQGDMRTSDNGKDGPTDSELQWQDVTLNAQYGDKLASVSVNNATGQVGIEDGAEKGGPLGQIQYDRETGISENLSVKLDAPATSGSFTISRLFENEGAGDNNHESGSWIAYLGGVAVASGAFDGADLGRGNRGEFQIDTNGYAFDEIVYSATEFTQGLQGDTSNDSSDYYLAGLEVEAKDGFTIVRGSTLTIPVDLLLDNAHDLEGDKLHIGEVSVPYEAGGVKIVDGNVEFYSRSSYKGDTVISVEIVDEHGGVTVAEIPVSLKGSPHAADVVSEDMTPVLVNDDEQFQFDVVFDKVTLEPTLYQLNFASVIGVIDPLSDLTFTNGVKAISGESPTFVLDVPEGIKEFDIYIDSTKLLAGGDANIIAADTLSAGKTATDGNDIIVGEGSDDQLDGRSGDDILFAREGDDVLNGGQGKDILIGGLGADILTGGDEVDIFKWLDFDTSKGNVDTVTDFELGSDKLDVSDLLEVDSALQDVLDNIVIEKDIDLDITISDGNSSEIKITLENNSNQFDAIDSGTVTGDNLKVLVDSLFINLPE